MTAVPLSLSLTEQSAVRRLLLAEPDARTVVDEQTMQALLRLVPSDGIGAGEIGPDGYVQRAITLPCDLHADLAGEPACEDGVPWTGVVQLAALRHDDPDVLLSHRVGVLDNVWVGVRGPRGTYLQFWFERSAAFYDDRDLAMIRMLEPALVRLLRARTTVRGDPLLTVAERRVLELVATGASNAEVAEELFVSVATVRKHLEHTYRKLGVSSRTAAVALQWRSGVVESAVG